MPNTSDTLKIFEWRGPLNEAYMGAIFIIAPNLEKARKEYERWVEKYIEGIMEFRTEEIQQYLGDIPCCEGINQIYESDPDKVIEIGFDDVVFIGCRGSY